MAFSGAAARLQGQDSSASEWELEQYLERIDTAEQMRNYNLALKLLLEAQRKFPRNALLYFLSGELYEQQNLLHLSLESFQRAQQLQPHNSRYIFRIANLQDRLGKYAEAVESYHLLERSGNGYERNEARRKNGWLLYKLHRYAEAEASILAIPPEQRNSSIMMTLAIIYSAAYNYEESRKAYEQSLALTYTQFSGNNYGNDDEAILRNLQNSVDQRALVYYNYALLETDFRHFDRAMEFNEKSIENDSVPSNELLRGELYLQQRKFGQAREAFIKSQRLEELSQRPSPLALLYLVQLAIEQGQNEEALIFFRELELRFRKQTEWMTSYSIDPVNFELELMKLRTALYKGLRQEKIWLLPLNTAENFQRTWDLLKYSCLYWYSSVRQKLLAYQVGKEHYQQGNALDSSQKLYEASDDRSQLRRRFFQELKTQSLALIPASKEVLLLKEAILERNAAKIEQSIKMLDPKWDAGDREQAYIELSKLRHEPAQRFKDLLQAYRSNRAALKNEGIALPLQLQLSGSVAQRPEQQRIVRQLGAYLKRSGAELIDNTSAPVLRLQIQWSRERVQAYLLSAKGTVLESIDSNNLEMIMRQRKEDAWSAAEQRRLLKLFARSFIKKATTPPN